MEDRRAPSKFTEHLSLFMASVAAVGAFFVLADPKVTIHFWGQTIVIDGVDFSADLKGAVIFAILIGGWVAVKEYWLGASDQGKKQQESMARIAEQAAPGAAAASSAATAATTAATAAATGAPPIPVAPAAPQPSQGGTP